MACEEPPEKYVLRIHLTDITNVVELNLDVIGTRLVEKGFITQHQLRNITGTLGQTPANKASSLMDSVVSRIDMSDNREEWFEKFVDILANDTTEDELVEKLSRAFVERKPGYGGVLRYTGDHGAGQKQPYTGQPLGSSNTANESHTMTTNRNRDKPPPTEQSRVETAVTYTAYSVSSLAAAMPSPAVATAAPSPAMLSYQNMLKHRYSTHKPVLLVEEWPRLSAIKYISLAMIMKETVERGNISDDNIHATIHGNMDDILHEKVSVEVDQLFSLDSDERQVILVEGAPGSGKSTLLWHMCQKWQSGELFQQFTLVLLVLLRDTHVHTAQSLADILPCVPSRSSKYNLSEYRKTIASDIEDRHGAGVLIMLDGWDEAPANLRQEGSLIHDIIADPCSLEAAAVVVSCRPSASHDIREYASTRVEVVGFTTREKREEYVRAALQDKPQAANLLLQQIESVPQLGANCHLPLTLAIITHTFMCSKYTLPSTYCRIIITLALSRLLRHIQKSTPHGTAVQSLESFSDLPDGTREEFLKLCKLAYKGVVEEKYSFSSEDLREIIQVSATDVPQIMTFGLLQAVHSLVATGSSTVYHFLHLSLQELCAAYHIASLPSPETEHVRALKMMVTVSSPQTEYIRALEMSVAEQDLNPCYTFSTHFQLVCEFYSALTRLDNPQVASQLLHIYKCENKKSNAIECECASFATESYFKCLTEADNKALTAKIATEIIGTSVKITSSGRALASVIEQAPHLKSVSCKAFPPALSKALSGKKSLEHLEIDTSYCIDMEHVKHVLKTCANLEHLDVRVEFRSTEVYHLADVLSPISIQTLDLNSRRIGEAGIIALSSALKTNNTIQHLTVSCKDVGPHGQEALIAALSQNTSLTTLEIEAVHHFQPFTEDDRTFFSGLKQIPSLIKFSINFMLFEHPSSVQALKQVIHPFGHTYVGKTLLSGNLVELADILKLNRPPAVDKQIHIDLNHNRNNCKVHCVCMTVDFNNTCFVHLKFSACKTDTLLKYPIKSKGMKQLVKSKVAVAELDLSQHNLGNTGAQNIANVMILEKLDISFCGIGEDGVIALSSALKTNTTLKCLKAHGNRFGDKGASHLAEALSHTSLEEIDISDCSIGEEGMVALSSALSTNTTLKCLKIHRNNFGDKGASHLAKALSHTSLQEIDISDCGIKEGMIAFSSALSTNSTLQHLDISGNPCRGEGIVALSSALCTNTTLTHLTVSLWEIHDHSRVALARAILQNTSLTNMNDNRFELYNMPHLFTCKVTQELLKDTSTFYTGIKRSPIVKDISIERTTSLGQALWSGNMEDVAEILELNQPPAVEKTLHIHMSNNTWVVDYGARTVCETDKGLLKVRSIYNDRTLWSSLRELTLDGMVVGGIGACLLTKMLNETQIQKLSIACCRIPEDGIVALSQALSTNTTLKYLAIGGNRINKRGQEALTTALTKNTTLAVLDISMHDSFLPYGMPAFDYNNGQMLFQSLNQFSLSTIVKDRHASLQQYCTGWRGKIVDWRT